MTFQTAPIPVFSIVCQQAFIFDPFTVPQLVFLAANVLTPPKLSDGAATISRPTLSAE
jgi:hypothetical protein